jgi:hypothetical protein
VGDEDAGAWLLGVDLGEQCFDVRALDSALFADDEHALGEGFTALTEQAHPVRVGLIPSLAGEAHHGEEALDGGGELAGGGRGFRLGGEVPLADVGMGVEEASEVAFGPGGGSAVRCEIGNAVELGTDLLAGDGARNEDIAVAVVVAHSPDGATDVRFPDGFAALGIVLALDQVAVGLRETRQVGQSAGGDDILAQVRAAGHFGLDGEAHRLEQVFAEELKVFTGFDLGKVDGHEPASCVEW